MLFDKVLILGLGLIGGSWARKLISADYTDYIVAIDPYFESLQQAQEQNIIQKFYLSLEDFIEVNVEDFDCIIIATFVGDFSHILRQISPLILANTSVFDVGSTKQDIVVAARTILIDHSYAHNFIAAHPIAGKELSGFVNSEADLFDDAVFIITPVTDLQLSHNNFVKFYSFFEKIFNKVIILDSQYHDQIYGFCSHFVQLIFFILCSLYQQYNLVGWQPGVMRQEFCQKFKLEMSLIEFDFSSVASIEFDRYKELYHNCLKFSLRLCQSNLLMWEPIFQTNQTNISDYSRLFAQKFDHYNRLLENNYSGFCQELKNLANIYRSFVKIRFNFSATNRIKYQTIILEILYRISVGKDVKGLTYEDDMIAINIMIAMVLIKLSIDNFDIKSDNKFLRFLGKSYLDSISIVELF